MQADIAEFGDWLAVPSVLLLWFAVLVRSRSALNSPRQRGLWLAVATAAAAMTLNLPSVIAFAERDADLVHVVGLVRNLIGVLSAGAVLYFVCGTTTGRKWQLASSGATVVLLGSMLALDVVAPPHGRHGIPPVGDPVPPLSYWLTLMFAHLLANTVCVFVCWRYSRRAENPGLAAGLRLFGLGTALVGLFWVGYLLKALFGTAWQLPYLPLLMNMHGVLRAGAVLLPTFYLLRRTVADMSAAWQLWPLWRDLVQSVPQVALHRPRATRWVELLWPPLPRDLLVYRKVIETRDAILMLGEYVAPGTHDLARSHLRSIGRAATEASAGPPSQAAVLACVIREARRAAAAGLPRQSPSFSAPVMGGSDLDDERRFLLDVAHAYRSPVTAGFRPSL
ncbi:MAB_1171c family putative transporter [Streptomyces sp. NPDC002889]|uniref:MAB_1171c family putative transporter n=1 Tax=Streptomyces sp. NPDC002889 TaxID=3364669 RepID=UPI0036A4F67E